MTGAGAPGAAGIIKCLQQDVSIQLTVADADANAVGKYLVDDFIQIPQGKDENFTNALLKVCKEKNIQVLLPLVTAELFPLSHNKYHFEEINTRVMVSSEKAINIANDKSNTYQFLQSKNIEVPQFKIAKNIEEFKTAVADLGFPKKTICFKPSISNGSRGFRIIADDADEFDLLFNQKPNSTYISYNDAVRVLSSKAFPELLVAEYLPGEEYSVDCLAAHGKIKLIVPRLRKKTINGISVQGEFVEDKRIIEYCSRIIETIGLHGNIGIQLRRSQKGTPLLLEINPRVQGTIVAALGAGINLPLLAIKQELNLPIHPSELKIKWGTKFSRHWNEVFY